MTDRLSTDIDAALLAYVLRLADDQLVLGHRLSEWVGSAPLLEEELAIANMGLDLIGQARALYAHAGVIEGRGNAEDHFAYLRDVPAYANALLVELPNGDFAFTMARQFLYAAFMEPFWAAMAGSRDATLAALGATAKTELSYHRRHCAEWLVRLGDGTDESHCRAQDALDTLWPYTGELFEVDDILRGLIESGIAPDPTTLHDIWLHNVDAVLADATLTRPDGGWMQTGGRTGRHSEHLGYLLAELQYLQRAYPGAEW
jgi:ring-1,2-phenylacetyl-CoA epoxidase subunit PaaC